MSSDRPIDLDESSPLRSLDHVVDAHVVLALRYSWWCVWTGAGGVEKHIHSVSLFIVCRVWIEIIAGAVDSLASNKPDLI